ncbi:MAG: PAS domain S-box protein [Pyrinomonadaceae bacterium]|nr:PAS domain S-box protein [Pyrinomonadaceae bacterium]
MTEAAKPDRGTLDFSDESPVSRTMNNFKRIFEIAPNPILIADKKGNYFYANQAAGDFLGYSVDELLSMNVAKVLRPDDLERLKSLTEKLYAGEGDRGTWEYVRKNGTIVWGESHLRMIDENFCVAFIYDLSESKRAQEKIRESEERYRAFIQQSSEGIWRLELELPISTYRPVTEQIELLYRNGYVAECNDAMARQFGYSNAADLVGKRLDYFLKQDNDEHQTYLKAFIESGYYLINKETTEKDKNGRSKYFINNLLGNVENRKLLRLWGTKQDITAAKETEIAYLESEEKQRQSGKVEAIGRLAGGVAHDFNNFLAVIMLHVDMLKLQLPADSPLRFRIDEIKSVTDSAATMVRQLLAFGRKQTLQPNPVVLNKVVNEFRKIIGSLIGEDIEIEVDLDPDLGVCFVDQHQITQVLMNLAVNARDAMPDGGKLVIATSNIDLDRYSKKLRTQPTGSYVQLYVADNGIGMDKNTRHRIFEPFFTTKEASKGTGLGLATVYGIVKQSNGFIWVESTPNEGTSFAIQFPRIDTPPEQSIAETAAKIPSGHETILLVEDEDQIRRAAVEVLNVLGYEVFEASSGMQALQLAKLYQHPIHLLLTDVIMPRMNGRELAEKIKEIHPETTVLYMSGYTDDIISKHGVLDEDVHFLSKPFTPSILATKIREILES